MIRILIILAFIAPSALALADEATQKRRIALTFDGAPRFATDYFAKATDRTAMLNRQLFKMRVPTPAFFCNTAWLEQDYGLARLRDYIRFRHAIGNQSHSNADIDAMSADEFIADIAAAADVLAPMGGYKKWFRFPGLYEGSDAPKRQKVHARLHELGYLHAYVTIPTHDWYLDKLLQGAVRNKKRVHHTRLVEFYLDTLSTAADFYDQLAIQILGYSPSHVMQLHENDLSAQYVDRLVAKLKQDGWQIISAEAAYADELARQNEPQTLQVTHGRVAAMAIDRDYRGPITGAFADPMSLNREFARRQIIIEDR